MIGSMHNYCNNYLNTAQSSNAAQSSNPDNNTPLDSKVTNAAAPGLQDHSISTDGLSVAKSEQLSKHTFTQMLKNFASAIKKVALAFFNGLCKGVNYLLNKIRCNAQLSSPVTVLPSKAAQAENSNLQVGHPIPPK